LGLGRFGCRFAQASGAKAILGKGGVVERQAEGLFRAPATAA